MMKGLLVSSLRNTERASSRALRLATAHFREYGMAYLDFRESAGFGAEAIQRCAQRGRAVTHDKGRVGGGEDADTLDLGWVEVGE